MEVVRAGGDLVLVLGGGEAHVGGAVVKVPGKRARVVRLGGHYDWQVLKPIAEAASKKYKCTAVAVGGIHVEDATRRDIGLLVRNCGELERCI